MEGWVHGIHTIILHLTKSLHSLAGLLRALKVSTLHYETEEKVVRHEIYLSK